MSIQEIQEKIKTVLQDNRLFYGLAFVLVAGISFGIGRLSMSPFTGSQKTAEIVQKIDLHPSTQGAAGVEAGNVVTVPSATATATAPIAPPLTTGAYVASKKGEKYHLPWCSGAKRITEGNKVWFATKQDAEKAGYTPASNCPGI